MKLNSAASLLAALALFALMANPLRAQSNLLASPAYQTQQPPAAAPAEDSHSHYPFSAAIGSLIPLAGIVMGCGIPIVIVVTFFYFNYRKSKIQHDTLRAMVEKGVPIPPEMFTKPAHWPNPPGGGPRNDLRTGLVLAGLGVGVILCVGKPGLIIFFLGLAYMVVGFFERKKAVADQTPKP
jgi:hypothetical protein